MLQIFIENNISFIKKLKNIDKVKIYNLTKKIYKYCILIYIIYFLVKSFNQII